MERIILHSDINACYANIELLHRPELRGQPVAVAGAPEARHGVILAKSELAKAAGVKTGMALWQARRCCPELVVLPPRMPLYARFAGYVREIYADYTDRQEPFGLDESWLDLSGCTGDGTAAAEEIRRRVREELGLTVSIGVSWNKVFSKLGSDYRKPDAVTALDRDNYRELLWPLPVESLLCVGRATGRKLRLFGISTIGQLAAADPSLLQPRLGKMAYTLWAFANGLEHSPVRRADRAAPVKSIGNSTTTPRDLCCDAEVRITLLALAESVGARLRAQDLRAGLVELGVRDAASLDWKLHQRKLLVPTDLTLEILELGFSLFRELHQWPALIRSLSIRCDHLSSAASPVQTDLFGEQEKRDALRRLDGSIDRLRDRFGYDIIRRGTAAGDLSLGRLNAREDHTVHPVGFFNGRTAV